MSKPTRLIVGLGNPGREYEDTRHNVGARFVLKLASDCGVVLKAQRKFAGSLVRIIVAGIDLRLLIPSTYVNNSGRSVAAVVNFFSLDLQEVLIVHDELDLPVGISRFKCGGGLGGHNGLRDITRSLGGRRGFNRLRIGVGHPGEKDRVTGHVLGRASAAEEESITASMDSAMGALPLAIAADWDKAMNILHSIKTQEDSCGL